MFQAVCCLVLERLKYMQSVFAVSFGRSDCGASPVLSYTMKEEWVGFREDSSEPSLRVIRKDWRAGTENESCS